LPDFAAQFHQLQKLVGREGWFIGKREAGQALIFGAQTGGLGGGLGEGELPGAQTGQAALLQQDGDKQPDHDEAANEGADNLLMITAWMTPHKFGERRLVIGLDVVAEQITVRGHGYTYII